MSDKPRLWITRKLSAATEARARSDYDVILNPEDRVFTAEELVAGSAESSRLTWPRGFPTG